MLPWARKLSKVELQGFAELAMPQERTWADSLRLGTHQMLHVVASMPLERTQAWAPTRQCPVTCTLHPVPTCGLQP